MWNQQDYASSKIRELVLYVAGRCADNDSFCIEKLNKILFYSDFWAYLERGAAITGAEYEMEDGVPSPKSMDSICEEMRGSGELELAPEGDEAQRPRALRAAAPDAFAPDQLAVVDDVIERLWDLAASDVTSFPPQPCEVRAA